MRVVLGLKYLLRPQTSLLTPLLRSPTVLRGWSGIKEEAVETRESISLTLCGHIYILEVLSQIEGLYIEGTRYFYLWSYGG